MIQHVVMWKFKEYAQDRTKEENLRYVKEKMEALPAVIDCLLSMEVHFNINDKPGMYDAVAISTFKSVRDITKYRLHPEHKYITEYIALVREGRASVDFDLETDDLML